MAATTIYTREPHGGTSPAAALTTVFTPTPNYCATGSYRFGTSICMPTNWDKYWGSNVGYYSPAICPSGYTSACSPKASFGPTVEPTETAVVCCPSYYSCVSEYTSYCVSTSIIYSYNSSAGSTVTSTSSDSPYAIQIRWADSDLAVLQTHPLTPGAKPTVSSTITPGSTVPSAGPASTISGSAPPTVTVIIEDGGLSTSAKIGIGVGVPLFCITVLAIVFFILWRRKSAAAAAHRNPVDTQPPPPPQQQHQSYYGYDPQQQQGLPPQQQMQIPRQEMGQPVVQTPPPAWMGYGTSPEMHQYDHVTPKDDRYSTPAPAVYVDEIRDGARELPGSPRSG